MKNVKFGPQLKKKSDYKEENIEKIDNIVARVSDKIYDAIKPKVGDKLTLNGGIVDEKFQGTYLKRTSKVSRI